MQYQWRNQNYYEVNDMKQNWTYKKLGEVVAITMGQSPASDTYNESEGLPFFQGNADFGKLHPNVRIYCNAPIRIADNGDVLISVRAPIGAINIADRECCIGRGLAAIRGNDNYISRFIYYLLMASKEKLVSQGTGSTFKSIGKDVLYNMLIPVPPLSTQSRIVSELDLLQSIIGKQKAQLKELDNLAQAIFYDMFGDPVENEKGWEVKKLGEICEVYRGGSPRPIEQYLGGTIPWIKIGDATKGDDIYLHQTKEHIIEEGLKKTRFIHSGSLIFANCGVSLGFARIISFDGCIHDGWLAFDNISNYIEKVFLLKSLNFCTSYFRSIAPDGTQPNLNTTIMKSFKQILPPMDMQKQYIGKVETIERLKAKIEQSLIEAQRLFDCKMDEYFG